MTTTESTPSDLIVETGGPSLISTADHYNTPLGPDGTPYAYIEALRDELEEPRIGWSEAYGGFWVVGGYDETIEIMNNKDVFSNRGVTFPRYETGGFTLMLAGQDEPEHKKYRSLVAGPFSPQKTAEFTEQLRRSTNDLIDGFIADGKADLARYLADEVPAILTAILLGLPPEDGDMYRRWMWAITHWFVSEPEKAAAVFGEMMEHANTLIEERRRNPGTDIMSLVIQSEVDGERLSHEDLMGFFTVLLIGGIDNTAKFLSTTFWRLAWDVELRRRLIDRPDMMLRTVDELIRYYTPALVGREVMEKVTVGDVTMEPGQTALLWFALANRDRRAFPHPDVLIPERNPNRHLSLGHGIHRCLGVHLVRVETAVAITELLRRIPEFELDRTERPEWTKGQVCGFHKVPVVFPAGAPEG